MHELTIAEKVRRFFDDHSDKFTANDVAPFIPGEKPDSVRSEINNLVHVNYLESEKIPGSHQCLYFKSDALEKAYKAFFTMKPIYPKKPRLWA